MRRVLTVLGLCTFILFLTTPLSTYGHVFYGNGMNVLVTRNPSVSTDKNVVPLPSSIVTQEVTVAEKAVVRISYVSGNSCTGALITPTIVAVAGACIFDTQGNYREIREIISFDGAQRCGWLFTTVALFWVTSGARPIDNYGAIKANCAFDGYGAFTRVPIKQPLDRTDAFMTGYFGHPDTVPSTVPTVVLSSTLHLATIAGQGQPGMVGAPVYVTDAVGNPTFLGANLSEVGTMQMKPHDLWFADLLDFAINFKPFVQHIPIVIQES